MPGNSARSRRGPTNPRGTSNVRVQRPTGLAPIYGDWAPDEQSMDPRNTRIGPSMCGDRTPEGQDHRTQHPPDEDPGLRRTETFAGFGTSWDSRLREIRDFMGFKTSQDPGLRGIQDFAGLGTSWDLGLRRKQELYTPRTRILFCGVL